MPTNEWDDYADEWDCNAATGEYADKAYGDLISIIKPGDLRVLDFGCGTGLLSERLSSKARQIVALDSSEKMINRLSQKSLPNVCPVAGFLSTELVRDHPLLQTKFDLITASSVCAFLPDYENTLSILRRLMVPDGIYVQWDWCVEDGNSDVGFSEKEVGRALTTTGFTDITLSQPFIISTPQADMPVLMAVARNT